jgi:small subunit ribosomal protein S6
VRLYELMFILEPTLENDEAIDAQISRLVKIVTDHEGKLENVDKWGKRKLAYEINGNTEGYYVIMTFRADNDTVDELVRIIKITDTVLRHILVRKEDD